MYHLAQSIDADRYTNICTIPQGFRPRHRICFYTPIVDATTGIWIGHAFCTINADGSVYLKTDDVSLNFCYINATYIAYN